MSSKSYSTAVTADNRVQLDSTGGGKFVAPMAISSDPGSLALGVGDYSNVNLAGAAFRMGMSGSEVKDLLGQQGLLASEQIRNVADYSAQAISAVQANKAAELTAVTGELPNWQKYIPLGILAAVAVLALRGRKT
jgi:hypothetical protein